MVSLIISPMSYTITYIGLISTLSIYSKLLDSPIKLSRTMITLYNTLNTLLNCYILNGLYPHFIQYNEFNIVTNFDNLEFYAYLHIIANVIGFFDTAIIILTHNWSRLTKFQLYYSGTIGMLWLYIIKDERYRHHTAIYFGMLAGSYYNTLMYIHYTITGLGYKNQFKNIFIKLQASTILCTMLHTLMRIFYNSENNLIALGNVYYLYTLLYLYHSELLTETPNKKRYNNKSLHVQINNKIYDATEFQNRHPGGNVLKFYNCIDNNVDATDAFNTFHLRSKYANKHLVRLPVIRTLNKHEFVKKNADFKKLIAKWKKNGYFNTKYKFFIIWALVVFLSTIASYYLMYLGYPVVGGVMVGISWTHCGFIQHHSGHLGFSGNNKLDILIQTFYEGLLKGGSARWWRNRHNKHHAMPNSIEHDGDLRTTPFFAWDPVLIRKVPTYLLRIQHLIFIPIMFLYVPVFFITTKLFIIRKKYWDELAIIFLHFYFSSFFVTNLYNFVLFYMIGYSIQGFYLGIMFALNHFTMARIDNVETTWEKWQMDATCNWGVGNRYAEILSGFLNIQIEHHIAPQMPAENMHLIIPDVIKYSHDNNIPYINYTFIQAFANMIRGLRETGITELERRIKLK